MFLYMFAFQLTSVIEQAFFVHKACQVNHNYSAEICNNLTQHPDINKEVQVKYAPQIFNYLRVALKTRISRLVFWFFSREQFLRSINGIIFPVMWCQLLSRYFWVHGQIGEVVNCLCCSDYSESSSTLWRLLWMHCMVRNTITWNPDEYGDDTFLQFRWLAAGICHLHGYNSVCIHWRRRINLCICLCLHIRYFGCEKSYASCDRSGGVLFDNVSHRHHIGLISIQSRVRSHVHHYVRHKWDVSAAGNIIFRTQFEGNPCRWVLSAGAFWNFHSFIFVACFLLSFPVADNGQTTLDHWNQMHRRSIRLLRSPTCGRFG